MTRAQRLAFLRVLASVAWADGEVQESERNRIKRLFNGFELDAEHRRELDAMLARPIDLDDAIEATKEFAGTFALPAARRQLLDEIEAMLGDEAERAEGERDLLDHVRAILAAHGPVDGLVEKLRGLFGSTLFASRSKEESASSPDERDRQFLLAVSDDRPELDSDLQRIAADYARHATMDDRLRVLDRLFARAAGDGVIVKREAEHIYRVAHLLWISNPEYLAVRSRWRDHIE